MSQMESRLNDRCEKCLAWNFIDRIFGVFLQLQEQSNNSQPMSSFRGESSSPLPVYGINKLTVAAHHRRSLILSGNEVTFHIRDSKLEVVYTVQTWLNNPNSLFNRDKRLSASVECSSSGKVFSIGVPGYPNKEADLQNRTALIVSGFEQAQVLKLRVSDCSSLQSQLSRMD